MKYTENKILIKALTVDELNQVGAGLTQAELDRFAWNTRGNFRLRSLPWMGRGSPLGMSGGFGGGFGGFGSFSLATFS